MKKKLKKLNNVLLISGSGHNCGKTTVACNIIRQLADKEKVYALKITPHFHLTGNNQQIIAENGDYRIFRERDDHSGKDTSRMLKAGAEEVYFIQCTDEGLTKVYKQFSKLIPQNCAVVCESGSFANIYQPGLHILVKGNNADNSKKSYLSNLDKANVILKQKDISQTSFKHRIEFSEMQWTINKINHDQVRRST